MLAALGSFIACLHPAARVVAVALLAAALIHLSILLRTRRKLAWGIPAVYLLLLVLVIWLGSFSLSPLGFGRGRFPVLMGFRVSRPQRAGVLVARDQTVTLSAGTAMEVQPVLLPVPATCIWAASNGALEDPSDCDTAYAASPRAAFDVLRVRIRPACSLPAAVGELKISLLP